jgi:hypothetical protein
MNHHARDDDTVSARHRPGRGIEKIAAGDFFQWIK